jgi:hypothetical protein
VRRATEAAATAEAARAAVAAAVEAAAAAELVKNRCGPSCANDAGVRKPYEQVPQRGRIENAGVVEDDKRHRAASVPEPVLLCLGSQLVEDGLPMSFVPLLVFNEIGYSDATMRADEAKRDFTLVEQTDEKWTRNIEQVRGLLRGEFGVDRDDGDSVPVCHLSEHFKEQLEGLARYGDRHGAALTIRMDLNGPGGLATWESRKGAQRDLRFLGRPRGRQLDG